MIYQSFGEVGKKPKHGRGLLSTEGKSQLKMGFLKVKTEDAPACKATHTA